MCVFHKKTDLIAELYIFKIRQFYVNEKKKKKRKTKKKEIHLVLKHGEQGKCYLSFGIIYHFIF